VILFQHNPSEIFIASKKRLSKGKPSKTSTTDNDTERVSAKVTQGLSRKRKQTNEKVDKGAGGKKQKFAYATSLFRNNPDIPNVAW